MKELLDQGKAPNCDYVHEQALVMNEAHTELAAIDAQLERLRAQEEDISADHEMLTQALANKILEVEIMYDGQPSQMDDNKNIMFSRGWHNTQVFLDIHRQAIKMHEDMKRPFGTMRKQALENIDHHTARHHRFRNLECTYEKHFMTPLNTMTTCVRALGSLVANKFTTWRISK